MKTLAAFKNLPFIEKLTLVKGIFAELGQHYEYFKDLHIYILKHQQDINEDFLITSYDIAYKLHKKLEK
jgi:hypothetical protein